MCLRGRPMERFSGEAPRSTSYARRPVRPALDAPSSLARSVCAGEHCCSTDGDFAPSTKQDGVCSHRHGRRANLPFVGRLGRASAVSTCGRRVRRLNRTMGGRLFRGTLGPWADFRSSQKFSITSGNLSIIYDPLCPMVLPFV